MLSSGIIIRMEGTEELDFTEEILGVSAPEQDLDKELQDLLKSDHTEEEDTASVCTAEEDKTEVLLASLIADLGKSDKVGEPIQEKVAKLVEGLCSGGLGDTQLKEKLAKYMRPSNVESLQPTTVNHVFWSNLQLKTKREDIKLQKLQLLNIKGMIVLSRLFDEVIASKMPLDKATIVSALSDALAFIGSGNKALNFFRRELIKPELKTEYQALCSSAVPVTTELFGDNVSQKVTDISEANKVSKRCLDPFNARRQGTRPYRGRGRSSRGAQSRFQPYDRRPFLGRGRTQYRPPHQKRGSSSRF